MTNFRTSAKSVEVSRDRVEFKTGSVVFIESFHTDTFEDGTVREYSQFLREDNRIYTKMGNIHATYTDKRCYENAIKRYKRQAKKEN